MNLRRDIEALSLRSLTVGALLCLWLFAQGLAAGHGHEGVQVHADCALCQIAQTESLPGTAFPKTSALPTRDVDATAPLVGRPLVRAARYFSPRAPPVFS